jgi:hypothetical protein
LYFGFPVRTEADQKIAGFRNDPTLRNYTTDILSQLALKGLRCIPVLETSCKASVAASGALTMLERLARFADVKADSQHIPPVITITSVGPNATVWLAFSDIIDDQYREHVRNLIPFFP